MAQIWSEAEKLIKLVAVLKKKNHFTLSTFINLSKAFDNADHQILISKLQNYGVYGRNLYWYDSYLKKYKQLLAFNINTMTLADIK